MGYLRRKYMAPKYDPAPELFRSWKVAYPELRRELRRENFELIHDPTPEPAISSYVLSQEQINELAVMEMDLQVKIADRELAIANKAREMMRKSMEIK
ncbi:MAG: hypothetical protein AB7V64_09665 [Methanothrix sp.]